MHIPSCPTRSQLEGLTAHDSCVITTFQSSFCAHRERQWSNTLLPLRLSGTRNQLAGITPCTSPPVPDLPVCTGEGVRGAAVEQDPVRPGVPGRLCVRQGGEAGHLQRQGASPLGRHCGHQGHVSRPPRRAPLRGAHPLRRGARAPRYLHPPLEPRLFGSCEQTALKKGAGWGILRPKN